MKTSASVIVLLLVGALAQNTHVDPQEEYETAIRDAFNDAYANRTDEVQEFFNKTFGAGGNASEVAERFKMAWKSASDGVKAFVNETYSNITRIMEGNETKASLSNMDVIGARIASYAEESVDKNVSPPETSRLDAIWNYFKKTFSKPDTNKNVTEEASLSVPPSGGHKGVYLGILTMMAAMFLVFQTTLNRNSILNKHVHALPEEASFVPSGYVRIT